MSFSEASQAMQYYRGNPVGFAYEMLNCQLQRWQAFALRVLADGDTERFSIKAGVGPGKTCLLAIAILWWLSTIYPSVVPCTAPSQHTLSDKLWKEIKKWMDNSKGGWANKYFEWQAQRIVLREAPQRHFAVGRVGKISVTASGDQSFATQGYHEENLLAVLDESSGIPDVVYKVLEGVMATKQAGDQIKILAAGNPDIPYGWFFETFKPGNDLWRNMTVNYRRADNLSEEWAQQMIKQYGRDSAFVTVKVFSLFPDNVEGGLIGRMDWEECASAERRKRIRKDFPLAARSLGIDVAGEGSNYNVATRAIGPMLVSNAKVGGLSASKRLEWAQNEIEAWEPRFVVVDADGGYGADLCSDLAPWLEAYRLRTGNSVMLIRWRGNASPNKPDKFMNARSELAWKIKVAIESGALASFADSDLQAQATGIKYENVIKRGVGAVIKLEDKKQFSKRIESSGGSNSPDELDSAMYALVPALYRTDRIPKVAEKPKAARYDSKRHERLIESAIV